MRSWTEGTVRKHAGISAFSMSSHRRESGLVLVLRVIAGLVSVDSKKPITKCLIDLL